MNPAAQQILDDLGTVDRLRRERDANSGLAAKVRSLKTYQARRFENTYADLLVDPRYRGAARFFLDELYGPQEFRLRDAQFARIVPSLVRMFPHEMVQTVAALSRLHALSELFDSEMSLWFASSAIDAASYVEAWQAIGRADARRQQIALTLEVGRALQHYTRSAVLRGALRMMRRPARAAGLGDLQNFLELGFDTFGALASAETFLGIVSARETALADALFAPGAVASATALAGCDPRDAGSPLGQLP